jgi:hypothetical protein
MKANGVMWQSMKIMKNENIEIIMKIIMAALISSNSKKENEETETYENENDEEISNGVSEEI